MSQSLVQRAIFICNSESFRRWVDRQRGWLDRTTDAKSAGTWLKAQIGIASRNELVPGSAAAQRFADLESRYRSDIVRTGFSE